MSAVGGRSRRGRRAKEEAEAAEATVAAPTAEAVHTAELELLRQQVARLQASQGALMEDMQRMTMENSALKEQLEAAHSAPGGSEIHDSMTDALEGGGHHSTLHTRHKAHRKSRGWSRGG